MFHLSTFYEKMKKKEYLRRPGIEPGSTAWKAAMLTIIPPTPHELLKASVGKCLLELHISVTLPSWAFLQAKRNHDSVAQW